MRSSVCANRLNQPAQSTGSIVITRLKKVDAVRGDPIDEPVLLRQATRPATRAEILERLGLADAPKRIAQGGIHKIKHPQRGLAVRFHPETQILDEFPLEDRRALAVRRANRMLSPPLDQDPGARAARRETMGRRRRPLPERVPRAAFPHCAGSAAGALSP